VRDRALLFQPFPLGRAQRLMPNRIWLPAMVTWRGTEDGFVTRAVHDIYLRYAIGGPGMIVLEATGIRDVASGPLLRLSHDRFIPGLKALVDEMRGAGDALVMPQIIDFLKIATRKPTRAFMESLVARGQLPASVLALGDAEFEKGHARHLTPRQQRDFLYGYRQQIEDLDVAEIRQIPGWFAAAARRARACGFDGVELHFAHAYTMASFLSVLNGRRDAYGGSLENRLRLPLEVVRAVREETGPDFILGCRLLGSEDILGDDGVPRGNTLADAQAIAVALARAGLDVLSVSRGGKFEDARQPPVGEAMYPYTGHSGSVCIPRARHDPPAVNTFLADGIRRAVRDAGLATPVVTAGKIHTFDQAEGILRDGRADLIGMARALLADPDLPRKWRAGQDADARACVFCPYCEEEDQHHRVVTCTLWPKDPGDHRRRLIPASWQEGRPWDRREVFTPTDPAARRS
jgi:2,4-dienoyl-CoA reductase-like NADH-dependent reductase (Old Yellow Enzyme family)